MLTKYINKFVILAVTLFPRQNIQMHYQVYTYKFVVMSNQRNFESNPRFNDGTYSRSTKDATTAIYLLPTHLISG